MILCLSSIFIAVIYSINHLFITTTIKQIEDSTLSRRPKFDDHYAYLHRYHPLLGYLPVGNYYENLGRHQITTNSRGERATDEKIDVNKPTLLILGDSQTWGYGIADKHIFSTLMKKEFQYNINIINWGVIGYSTTQSLLRWMIHHHQYKIDAVVLISNPNDILNNSRVFESGIFRPIVYLDHGQEDLCLTNIPVHKVNGLFRSEKMTRLVGKFYDPIVGPLHGEKKIQEMRNTPPFELFTTIITEFFSPLINPSDYIQAYFLKHKYNCPIQTVYDPAKLFLKLYDFFQEDLKKKDTLFVSTMLPRAPYGAEEVPELQNIVLKLENSWKSFFNINSILKPEHFLKGNDHLNEKGHRVLAFELVKQLKARGFPKK